jgi:YegS/Rv2252/BmrU family lipid kinase
LKRVLFIVNRKAGPDGKNNFPAQVNSVLDRRLFSWDIAHTRFQGHAVQLAADAAAAGVDIVAAVGGDGSVNEVARGILGTEAVLAVIPKGSGNGLSRALGIPRDIRSAIGVINRDQAGWIDAGYANDHLFLSNAGVGFDALVARLFTGSKGRGLFNYSRLVISALSRYESGHYHLLTGSGEADEQAFFVAAANGNQFGYGFKIAPDAKMDDGLLDICIMKPLRWWQLPAVSLLSLSGKLVGSRYAKQLRCRTLTLTRKEGLDWMQVDGDALPVENAEVHFRVVPRALRVLMPEPL